MTSLGHGNLEIATALHDQAVQLSHVSNLFGTTPGPALAAELDKLVGGGGQLFFCNSGAEANEAAIKLARRWGGEGRYVVVTASRSFHGRTLATLHATGQPEKHHAFEPLPDGFRHARWNDLAAMQAAITEDVAAVLLESIQGEGGVNEPDARYLSEVQELCRRRGVLFMVDEVQTGLARTGKWFGFQHYGVTPDVVTMAKALGNGFPIGAAWARNEVADAFKPGDHATTFGGQPLAAATASKVLEIMQRINAPALAANGGKQLAAALTELSGIASLRGKGLLLAAELTSANARDVAATALERGLVINGVTPTAIRLAPPLTVSEAEITEAVAIIGEVLT